MRILMYKRTLLYALTCLGPTGLRALRVGVPLEQAFRSSLPVSKQLKSRLGSLFLGSFYNSEADP